MSMKTVLYNTGVKKLGLPKFADGDKVICSFHSSPAIMTIEGDPVFNGFTWMYNFKGSDLRCGQQYLKPFIG